MTTAHATSAFLGDPVVHNAMDSADALARARAGVFREVLLTARQSRRRSGWLRGALSAAALPGGTPPGRSRPGPAPDTAS
jgi:hypothetical protein